MDKDIHGFDAFLDYFLETVVAAIITIFNTVGHVHAVHGLMLTFDLYVHDHPFKKLPSYRQIFRTLRTGTNNELSDANLTVLHHLDGWNGTDVFVLWMGYSSKICLQVLRHDLLLLDLNDWPVFLPEVETVLIEIDERMNFLDNGGEAETHAVMFSIVPIIIFMWEIKSHFDLEQLLFL